MFSPYSLYFSPSCFWKRGEKKSNVCVFLLQRICAVSDMKCSSLKILTLRTQQTWSDTRLKLYVSGKRFIFLFIQLCDVWRSLEIIMCFFFYDYYSACRFITTNFHTSTWSHLVRFHDFTVLGWPFGLWVTPRLRLCFFFLVNCLDVLYERWGKIDPELRRLAGHLLHVSVFWWHILYKQQDNHSTTAWAVDMGFLDYKWVLLLR